MVYNDKDSVRKWLLYVTTAFGGNYKYNFKGTCQDLFTLIGVIYCTWFVKTLDVRYCEAKEYNKDYKTIELIPWKDSYRTYERSNYSNE